MKTVMINAGHGGNDPGAVNGNNYEKNFTLKICDIVCEEILKLTKEIKIIRNRVDDSSLTIYDNVQICNNNKVDLFTSFHCNCFSDPTVHGQECFYFGDDESGRKFANMILTGAKQFSSFNRGSKSDYGYYEIKYTNCTSLIYEVAFISNREDLINLLDDNWCRSIAKNYAKQLLSLFGLSQISQPSYNVANEINYMAKHSNELFSQNNKDGLKKYLQSKTVEIINNL
jgi:N-acetylmuramoyl-L-alanine amidase